MFKCRMHVKVIASVVFPLQQISKKLVEIAVLMRLTYESFVYNSDALLFIQKRFSRWSPRKFTTFCLFIYKASPSTELQVPQEWNIAAV